MITSLLIANRGEIARRIIRTARRLGVRTVAVYSEADANAPHVAEADEAVLIGPAPARESYLVADRILAAAKQTGAEAIHPGYGFLSENAAFAQAVIDAGLVWVGPPPAAINAMGLKDAAKSLMIAAGVPCTPGYLGDDQSEARLEKEAATIGYPVLIKAVAGGGGKGMRKVDAAADFQAALASCRREAAASFGDDRVLIEKYVTRPRHIEVQVFGDRHGHVVHLFERDCSLQRRHQKVIEEAPAPGMDAATRAAVCDAAVKAARAVNYEGAGTIEFIADASEGLRADRIWFMEMNTRLQVEHPVTEMITGQDLVEWQLRVASGEPLPLTQDEITMTGWAMEARLYAENPATGFLPSTGPLKHFRLPAETLSQREREGPDGEAGGRVRGYDADAVRVDSAVEEGGDVTPFYDPMIAKLIVHADTREAAAEALADACGSVEVWPVRTNAAFLARCAGHPDFVAGEVDTGFIERRLDTLLGDGQPSAVVAGVAATALVELQSRDEGPTPWSALDVAAGFRLNGPPRRRMTLICGATELEGELLDVDLHPEDLLVLDEDEVVVFEYGEAFVFRRPTADAVAHGGESDGAVISPMPGKVVSVSVKAGDTVSKGQTLLVLEAMKMEHALAAPFDGVVAELTAVAGGQVSEGVVLVRLEAAEGLGTRD
jgi:propionyl-CoA carboxylase alpha chain/3-methylcrotonyl-CoA carboxylase alpha subunit